MSAFPAWAAVSGGSVREAVTAYERQHAPAILDEFRTFLSIPNVAADRPDIEKNAEELAAMMQRRGLRTQLLRVEGAPPAVFGELRAAGAQKTIALYAHYDGQPVDKSKWNGDPWAPVIRTDLVERGGKMVAWGEAAAAPDPQWRVFARSASDDKATIVAMLSALDAMRAANIAPGFNLKFLFEGEEEAGSPHLERYLSEHKDLLAADLWLICDGPVHQSGRLQLYFGARGVTGTELTVYGPTRPLHSGHYGNWAPNPAVELAHLIASMRDENGRILIPGWYDDVRPLSPAEKKALAEVPPVEEQLRDELSLGRVEGDAPLAEMITRPALNIRGIRTGNVGSEAANAIPTTATASIDFRLVPDEKPERVRQLVEAHLGKLGYTVVHDMPDARTLRSNARVVKVEWEAGYPSARAPMDDPHVVAVAERIEAVTGQKLVRMPTLGGSVPLYLFFDVLHAPAVGLPIANYDNNQHGANENIKVGNLWSGIEEFVGVFTDVR